MKFDVDLSTLGLGDDLEIGEFGVENPDAYVNEAGFAPPDEGNYEILVTGFRLATDFTTKKPVIIKSREDGKDYPTFEVNEIQLLAGPSAPRERVMVGQRISTLPRKRSGAKGEGVVSQFADFLRAFDETRPWKGILGEGDGDFPTGLTLAQEFVETRVPVKARISWKAYDKTFVDNAVEALGGRDRVTKEEMGRILNEGTIRGMAKFPKAGNGKHVPEVTGPSGETLKARAQIKFYRSSEKVKIG